MHMPGHKRNPDLVPSYYSSDITEITGFDNLHDPKGMIRRLEESAASIWNGKSAVLSVNGASALILSAIMAASPKGKILIASNCHISVWHALELTNAAFDVIAPDTSPKLPHCLSISTDKLREQLEADESIKTVVITSPTYEGVVSDIDALTKIAHSHGVAIIVDEAHGAHLGLNNYFPPASAADVVIKSIHKTLHAPTQTAVLLTYTDTIHEYLIRHYMDILESSSPSYLLMEGISRVIYDLKENPDITSSWVKALKECRLVLEQELKHIMLEDIPGADPSKLVILTGGIINGHELAELLRERNIETEAAFDTHIIAMTGIGDTDISLGKFKSALIDIDKGLLGTVSESFYCPLPSSPLSLAMSIREAVEAPHEIIASKDAAGRISADYCFKYPPGIPVLIPGQLITEDRIRLIDHKELKVIRG